MAPIVLAENVYKSYRANSSFEINRSFQWIARRIQRKPDPLPPHRIGREFVLKDVSFALERHESLGLIGNNGAGKTTLFRLLSAITLPTRGRVRIEGRVSSLIALGAGFHPDLSGRENLYLNCALMGMSRAQTADRIDEIVDFAEIDEYIDAPIKHYSSGMLARLGFSVAVHLDPELILVDEVLAVGDYRFQVKSMGALRDFVERGTVILVSHDLNAIERICQRTIWLDRGEVKMDGPSRLVLPHYIRAQQDAMGAQFLKEQAKGDGAHSFKVVRQQFESSIEIHELEVHNDAGEVSPSFCMGDTITVTCKVIFNKPMTNIHVAIGLMDTDYQVLITSGDNQLSDQPDVYFGQVRFECRFPNVMLRPRRYGLHINVLNRKALMPLYHYHELDSRFVVTGETRDPALHYQAKQHDLVFTPGVTMRVLAMSSSLVGDSV